MGKRPQVLQRKGAEAHEARARPGSAGAASASRRRRGCSKGRRDASRASFCSPLCAPGTSRFGRSSWATRRSSTSIGTGRTTFPDSERGGGLSCWTTRFSPTTPCPTATSRSTCSTAFRRPPLESQRDQVRAEAVALSTPQTKQRLCLRASAQRAISTAWTRGPHAPCGGGRGWACRRERGTEGRRRAWRARSTRLWKGAAFRASRKSRSSP
mmetsp:Transcript_5383/g.9889  ORF Transcript_5383/g.9889 Transcript_5383/m.9889 type:complete len:212 (-) Transcript_5383:2149-2784(-)